jgi:hypothetical protein
MSNENTFLQQNFKFYQEWHHWVGKAEKLKRASLILYHADLPDLRLYDEAHKRALEEVGDEGKRWYAIHTRTCCPPSACSAQRWRTSSRA